jgi:ankyrin repeat protein
MQFKILGLMALLVCTMPAWAMQESSSDDESSEESDGESEIEAAQRELWPYIQGVIRKFNDASTTGDTMPASVVARDSSGILYGPHGVGVARSMTTERGRIVQVSKLARRFSPLWHAVVNGNKEVTQELIANGEDISIQDSNGDTLLHNAVENPAIIEILLKAGINPAIRNKMQQTCLHVVMRKVMVEHIDSGVKTTIKLLVRALVLWGSIDVVRHILLKPIDNTLSVQTDDQVCNCYLDALDIIRDEIKSIYLAADSKKLKRSLWPSIVKYKRNEITVQELHAIINKQDNLGGTYLAYAAVLGNVDGVQWLLTHGANPLLPARGKKDIFELLDHILQNNELTPTERETYITILRSCVKWLAKNLHLLQLRGLKGMSGKTLPNEILYHIMNKVIHGVVERYNLLAAEATNNELIPYEPDRSLSVMLKMTCITPLLLAMFGIHSKHSF